MVDDGSTDSSPEIAARFAEMDSRFRLVQQDNHGLGHRAQHRSQAHHR
jgi:CDP-glycerol glycerophosphotransferase